MSCRLRFPVPPASFGFNHGRAKKQSRALAALLIALLAAALAPHAARAADTDDPDASFPQPSPYPTSWQLDFKHAEPKRIVVDVPGSITPQAYWFVTYTVTNNTDQEQQFLPTFELLSGSLKLYKANQNIPLRVFQAIKNREHNNLLEPSTSITGTLRIGQAEARDGVMIWPEPAGALGHFSIFVTGLSGEAIMLKHADGQYQKVTDADQLKDPKSLIILRKTLQINYFIRGDAEYPNEQQVVPDGEHWIMR
jgi:hypothetical protein